MREYNSLLKKSIGEKQKSKRFKLKASNHFGILPKLYLLKQNSMKACLTRSKIHLNSTLALVPNQKVEVKNTKHQMINLIINM